MAELVGGALLSSFFQVAIEKLASSQFKDYFHRHKLDDTLVKKLEITLNSINQVLDDAEKKQYQSTYVKKWLDDLKHAVYETDLLFDEIATHANLKKSQTVTTKVRGFFSSSSNRFASRIKELLENLEFLAKQKKILGLGIVTCASNEGGVSWKLSERLPTTSLVDDSGIYGYEFSKDELVELWMAEAKSVSGEFCLRIESNKVQDILQRTRHVWFSDESTDADKIVEHICECKGLRSLMIRGFRISMNNSVQLVLCGNILLNEIPSNLKKASIYGTQIIELSLEQNLCNSACLEELNAVDFSGPNLQYNLNLPSSNSFRALSIQRCSSSSLSFILDLFSNLHSLTLHDCPQLESFPGNEKSEGSFSNRKPRGFLEKKPQANREIILRRFLQNGILRKQRKENSRGFESPPPSR
ncbi:hypothetical protein VNO77_26816 [Canavalia gladiata]|uniref:Disease resistance N-terminal domain-containing protein n=1 Tax=Canavalia gladiata TaxID=3824 RepID=A0AAN9Q5W8_CANGL